MLSVEKIRKKFPAYLPFADGDILLAHSLNKPKEFLCAHPEHRLALIHYLRFRYYLWQYRRGYSVAAIAHHKEFYGLDFYVNKHVLIPRPETEMIVDEVLHVLTTDYGLRTTANIDRAVVCSLSTVVLIDVGTGSGCIPIAIMKTIKHENNKAIAIDISRKVLLVARKNARTHNVPIAFLHGNLLEPFTQQLNNRTIKQYKNQTIIITANLPYLTKEQFTQEPSIQREPYYAFVTDKKGLALYKKLLKQIHSLLQATSYKLQAFLEINPSQSSAMIKLVNQLLPQTTVEIKKDLAGRDRVIKISSKKEERAAAELPV